MICKNVSIAKEKNENVTLRKNALKFLIFTVVNFCQRINLNISITLMNEKYKQVYRHI